MPEPHQNTFAGLEAADAAFVELAIYFEACRLKRRDCQYELAGVVNQAEADELYKTARKFERDPERWIARHFPVFA